MGTQNATQRLTRWDQLDAVLAKAEAGSRPVRLKGDREEEVRRVLSDHFGKASGHDLKDFGDEVEFESAEEFPVYKVELLSLYERREVAGRVEPHAGGDPAPPRVTEATIDAWVYDNPPPDAFAEGQDELTINDSRRLLGCDGCGGHGQLACGTCGGKGRLRCHCKDGTQSCKPCLGSGRATEETKRQVQRTCYCTGGYSGGKVCWKCNGRGAFFEDVTDKRSVTCGRCGGGGRVRCSACGGQKVLACAPPHGQCGGSGKLVCQKCQGSGRLAAYLAVVRSFTPGLVARTAAGDGIPAEAARELANAGVFRPVFEIDSLQAREQLTPSRGSPPLKRAVAHVIQAGAAGKPEGCRIAKQRLTVGVAHALKLEYTHEGKTYTAWLLGEEMAVFAPASPLTAAMGEMVREAVELWGGGQERKAALTLRDALDMAEKDPDCGAAYEELRGEVPRKLQERGKTATTAARWVRKNPLAVGCLLFVVVPPLLLGCLGVGTLALGLMGSREPEVSKWEKERKERQEAAAARYKDFLVGRWQIAGGTHDGCTVEFTRGGNVVLSGPPGLAAANVRGRYGFEYYAWPEKADVMLEPERERGDIGDYSATYQIERITADEVQLFKVETMRPSAFAEFSGSKLRRLAAAAPEPRP